MSNVIRLCCNKCCATCKHFTPGGEVDYGGVFSHEYEYREPRCSWHRTKVSDANVCDMWNTNQAPPQEEYSSNFSIDRNRLFVGAKIYEESMFRMMINFSGNSAGMQTRKNKMDEYKKYIRCHIVKAKPCTLGQWEAETGKKWNEADRPRTDEGYKCDYPDGYSGWCPKDAFEEVSRPIDGMTFGMAIEQMKRGKKVARRGWNGKGMWLCIPLVDGPKEIPATGIWGRPNAEYAEQNGGTVKVVPYVTMKAADGTIVMGWLASQTDMLSDDWVIVE